jgi:hypothetical protein
MLFLRNSALVSVSYSFLFLDGGGGGQTKMSFCGNTTIIPSDGQLLANTIVCLFLHSSLLPRLLSSFSILDGPSPHSKYIACQIFLLLCIIVLIDLSEAHYSVWKHELVEFSCTYNEPTFGFVF